MYVCLMKECEFREPKRNTEWNTIEVVYIKVYIKRKYALHLALSLSLSLSLSLFLFCFRDQG